VLASYKHKLAPLFGVNPDGALDTRDLGSQNFSFFQVIDQAATAEAMGLTDVSIPAVEDLHAQVSALHFSCHPDRHHGSALASDSERQRAGDRRPKRLQGFGRMGERGPGGCAMELQTG